MTACSSASTPARAGADAAIIMLAAIDAAIPVLACMFVP